MHWKGSHEQLHRIVCLTGPNFIVSNVFKYLAFATLIQFLEMHYFTITDLVPNLNIQKLDKNTAHSCFFCGSKLKLEKMRKHIGEHILKANREELDEGLKANGSEVHNSTLRMLLTY